MAMKKTILRRPGDYAEGKALLAEELSLEGTLDSVVDKAYTDKAVDDLERGSSVGALDKELSEAKAFQKKRKK
ncbi:hypothetical protein HY546_01265 [archaeon]|nr:hypothetical protein [archaeon]